MESLSQLRLRRVARHGKEIQTVDCTSFNCMCGRMLLCFTSIRSGLVLGAFVSCMFGALYMLFETFIPFVWFVWACENNAIQTWQH